MELKDRILEAMTHAKMSAAEFSRATGKTAGAVTQWLDGTTKSIKGETAAKIEDVTGYNANWLATGHGSKFRLENKRADPLIPSSPDKDRLLLIEKESFRDALASDALRKRVQFKPPHKDSKNICSYTDYRSDKLLLETLVNRNGIMLKNSSTAVLRLLIQHKNDGPGRRILAIAALTDQPITVTTDGSFDDYLPVVVQEACNQYGIRIKIVSTWGEAADWIVKLEKEDI